MKRTGNPNPGLPEFKYINGIPIVDVARRIGLQVSDDGKIVCRASSDHKPGRSPFLRILLSNKIVCDACDNYPMTVLDMVRDFGGFDSLLDAAVCVTTYFEVPRKPKGSHLNNPLGEPVPPACRDPLALLVMSGVWAELSVSVKVVIVTFLKLAKWEDDGEEYVLPLSYRAMMRYCGNGLQSPNEISEALTKLESIGWLERLPSRARGGSPVRDTARYRLTPLSSGVRNLADDTAQKFSEAIQAEKAVRRQKRFERDRKRMFPSLDISRL